MPPPARKMTSMLGPISLWTSHICEALPFLADKCSLVNQTAVHVCKTLDDARDGKARKREAQERIMQTLTDRLTAQLHRRIRRNTTTNTTTTTTMTDILQSLPEMTSSHVAKLLAWCEERQLYACLVVVALRYPSWLARILDFTVAGRAALRSDAYDLPAVLRFLLLPESGDLLDVLVADGVWPSWERLLNGMPSINGKALLQWLSRNRVNRHGLDVFKMLLDAGTGFRTFRKLLSQLQEHCLIPQFRALLFSERMYEGNRDNRACPLFETNPHFLMEVITSNNEIYPVASYKNCLIVMCEAGFFTEGSGHLPGRNRYDMVHYINLAVQYLQPHVVRFLYSTGNISNATVFMLSRYPALIENCERKLNNEDDPRAVPPNDWEVENQIAAREIRSFLESKASEPQSLRFLSLTQAATGLGWGYAKMTALNKLSLEMPKTVVEDLFACCDRSTLNAP